MEPISKCSKMKYDVMGMRQSGKDCNSPLINIRTLDQWKGPSRLVPYPYTKKPYHVFHMNTFTSPCTTPEECQSILRFLKITVEAKNQPDLRYNFIVGGDMNIYEARGFTAQPLLPMKYHGRYAKVGLLIGYIGSYADTQVPQNMWNLACHFAFSASRSRFILGEHKHHRIFEKPREPMIDRAQRQFGDKIDTYPDAVNNL